MKKIHIYTITSLLHDVESIENVSKEFLQSLGIGYDMEGEIYTGYGSHTLDVIYVRTGGTEGKFKKLLPELQAQSDRPFYLLIVGNEDDVRYFVLQYQKNLKDEIKTVIFARNLGVNNVLLQEANIKTGGDNKVKEAVMAKINTIVKNNNVMQFRLKLDEKISKVNLKMHTDALIGKFPDEYKLVIESLQKWKDNTFQNVEVKDFLRAEIKEFNKENEKGNLSMTLRVNPLGINKREGQYKAELALIPSKDDYLKSVAIFDEWNFYDSDITLGNIKGFGNKTLNISVFTKMMGNLNYEINKPGFYNLPIYLDAKK